MGYVDLDTVHNPTAGGIPSVAWGDQIRSNFEQLIAPPCCSVYGLIAVSVPNATSTAMNASQENYDTDTMHNTGSNTSRITATQAGIYRFSATVWYSVDIDGVRKFSFKHQATTTYECVSVPSGSAISDTIVSGSRYIQMAAAEYVEVFVTHTAGAALNCHLLDFSAVRISR